MTTANTRKTIIYVDASDEITAIINKMQDAPGKIVAIVLPKRAPAFQSTINIRLLKKTAEKAKKKAVLITSDKSILPLAGAAGIYVAKSPESRPFIPDAPGVSGEVDPANQATDELDPTKPVGELAARSTLEKEETIDLGDLSDINLDDNSQKQEKKPKKGIRVPNFNKFRLIIIAGIAGVILLGIGWYVAAFVLPRADIVIQASSQNIAQTVEFDVRTDEGEIDDEDFVIRGVRVSHTHSDTATVDTTGERNVGDRAEGELTLTNCTQQTGEITVPSGTEATSGNFTFITQESVTLPPSLFLGDGTCVSDSKDVDVVAAQPGSDHNLRSRSYTLAGYSQVRAEGSRMKDGTDEFIEVVAQRDIEAARQQIEQDATNEARSELVSTIENDGRIPLLETFSAGNASTQASPEEGEDASEVTVTSEVIYRMIAIESDEVKRLIELQLGETVNLEHQAVLDHGLADATFSTINSEGDVIRLSVRTIVAVGPDLKTDELIESIAGLRRSETESILLALDGVRDVEIDYSPFWVYATPNKPNKIHIEIQQQNTSAEDELNNTEAE